MTLVKFGDPSRFEIAVGWIKDKQPRAELPEHGGWSTGAMRITVFNHVLTENYHLEERHHSVHWYLLPVFEWFAFNWVELLHEQKFTWQENTYASAASVVAQQIHLLIDAVAGDDLKLYEHVYAWRKRHALRAADSSALYPDIFFRRYGNNIEISWTSRQPSFSPENFHLALSPGAATLAVEDVANPLWELLNWVVSAPPPDLNFKDRESLTALEARIEELRVLEDHACNVAFLGGNIADKLRRCLVGSGVSETSYRLKEAPALAVLDDAVIMFGSVSPELDDTDISKMIDILKRCQGGHDSPALTDLVRTDVPPPLMSPYLQGYDLALDLLHHFDLLSGQWVDVLSVVENLGIAVEEIDLSPSIRGIAIAGDNYAPAIFINGQSLYNKSHSGFRFTIAHELFHILYDREQARRVTHTSGRWAQVGVEKRANAFAAMFLMPRSLLPSVHIVDRDGIDIDNVYELSRQLKVSASAVIEHLYNLDIIDSYTRDELRSHHIH